MPAFAGEEEIALVCDGFALVCSGFAGRNFLFGAFGRRDFRGGGRRDSDGVGRRSDLDGSDAAGRGGGSDGGAGFEVGVEAASEGRRGVVAWIGVVFFEDGGDWRVRK